MSVLAFFAVVVIAAVALIFVMQPLFQSQRQRSWTSTLDELDRLLQEREMLLTNLKDLQMDFDTNKISEGEYETLRIELMKKGSHIYEAIETLEQNDPLIRRIEADSHV